MAHEKHLVTLKQLASGGGSILKSHIKGDTGTQSSKRPIHASMEQGMLSDDGGDDDQFTHNVLVRNACLGCHPVGLNLRSCGWEVSHA